MALRFDNHQMHIERLLRATSNCRDYHGANGDVGNEAPIHDKNMYPVGACRINRADLFPELREVRGQDRRRNHNEAL
jgi:hypothetical protein